MKTTSSTKILGIDLGDKKHSVCVLGADGKILDESTVANTREAMARLSKKHPGALVVMEAGTGQPATRPESKSEGGDKPQPEAEGRSR